ncbi:MAG: IS66 family transposase [Herpetosiphonaceae bacterium]|nr:IS66 family transposase [Herpetosiphonaceae bacterium]
MDELSRPPEISPLDWATTPPAVRALVHALRTQLQSEHLLLRQQVVTLQERVAVLEAQLNQHSGNSSRPPSSDPPSAPPRPPNGPTGRKAGAQPSHPGQHRPLLPPDQVTEFVVHRPITCPHCQQAVPSDLPLTGVVLRQQVWELPPLVPTVTEHQFPTVTCPHCQTPVRALRPPEVPPGSFGPHLVALLALLHGRYRVSTRDLVQLLADLWQLPISLGSVPMLYQTVSHALAPVYDAVQTTVQAQPVANVDETPWHECHRQRYLWVAVTVVATLFQVARRSRAALEALIGSPFGGIVGSDRYSAYAHLPVTQRQLCWAHLKREWQFFRERDGPVGVWGDAAMTQLDRLFTTWHRFRSGALDRAALQQAMAPIQAEVRRLVEEGRDTVPWEKARGFCRDLLLTWPALWTFVREEGVEPTNNAAERALRPAVLWRKGCYGTASVEGSRFVERILTVTTTCQQQQQPFLPFLADAVQRSWAGLPAPTLLPTT